MDIRKIKKLIELINETGVGEIEVKSGEESVRISRFNSNSTPPPPAVSHRLPEASPPTETRDSTPAETAKDTEGHHVKSPMVGTVYLSATPGEKPFVEIGQHVTAGDTLCIIEAMKMFNKIEADASGTISARLVDNEQPVEYDQSLFIIDSNG